MELLNKFSEIFRIRDLRVKILFILGVFVIFRIMANIPIPGVEKHNLELFFEKFQVFGLLNIFTGGALQNLSIAMLGLGPYITAVIIFQLLTMIFPQLEKLYKEEGEAGRRKFNQYCRIATVPLASLQAFGMLNLLQRQKVLPALSPIDLITSIITITAGCLFLMWLGELISEKGIGDGVSLLIFAGIVAEFPLNIYQAGVDLSSNPGKLPSYLFFLVISLIIITGVVIVNETRRNIPISYSKRVRGMKMYGGVSTYLPLNINPAGVIPIIFALAIVLFPNMIGHFLVGAGGVIGYFGEKLISFFDPQRNFLGYAISLFVLVVIFTFFYTMVTFDPKTVANNLKKVGGFIPGIRPGRATAEYLSFILNRILLFGSIFLGIIAILPHIVATFTGVKTFSFLIGGTSLLIIVAVVLDTWRRINTQLEMHEYEKL